MIGYRGNHKFVGDHMPPKSVANQMNNMLLRRWGLLPKVKYRFYPQCANCSNAQGSILSKASSGLSNSRLPSFVKAANLVQAGSGRTAHFHGLRFRLNHATGGVLAAATIVNASNSDISNGNRKRFKKSTQRAEELIKKSTAF